ncbi:MAG TPA: TIM-barrel domain-containing protein, partial [Bacteroidales bacterium]|nr:TIM-barrel domain-containing protein [Bacteroidales bacterium]
NQTHNIYGMQMAHATFDGTGRLLGNKRTFVVSRAGFAGIQRYSTVWTGDNVATDDHLLLGVRLVSSLGVSGLPFTGTDLGGFTGNPTKELFVRWLSVGVYTPFFRNHAEIASRRKEPWSFGEETEALSRDWIGQRYRLLPYLYSAFYVASQTGMPIQRTLAIPFPFDDKIYDWNYQNEYLFGDNILVAPVKSDQSCARVYLPEGGWYRFSSDEQYPGNSEPLVDCPLNDLPVFIRAGGILPLQSVIQSTAEKPSPVLELNIYYGSQGSTLLYYEDEGKTLDYSKGEYYQRNISFDPKNKKITLQKTEGSFASKFTSVKLMLHGFGDRMTVRVNGQDLMLKPSSATRRFCEFPLTNGTIEISY